MLVNITEAQRQAAWTQTYTGKAFKPLAPRAEDICIEDIAHGLDMQCRYNGQCKAHYSVAAHSLTVSYLVPPEHALSGLMHDASEAYITDIPGPIKFAMPDYLEIENGIMRAIAEYVGPRMQYPLPVCVNVADKQSLMNEYPILMAPPPQPWAYEMLAEPHVVEMIRGYAGHSVEREFLARYRELTQ